MGSCIERNDAGLVDHLVADRHDGWGLDDRVGVPIVAGHHRARQAPHDAPVVEAMVLPRIGRAPATPGLGTRSDPLATSRRERRDLAVRGIDHEPRAATLVRFVLIVEGWRAAEIPGKWIARERRVENHLDAALFDQLGELVALDVLYAPPVELFGTLERRSLFVLVRVIALQVGIAPW